MPKSESERRVKSWKTTTCGLLGIVGLGLTQFFGDIPLCVKLGGFLAYLGPAAGLLFARDNNVTSEDAGAVKPMASRITPPLMVVIVALSFSGCVNGPRAVVTVTSVVDSAMRDWAAASKAGQTTPALDAKVIAAHDHYRAVCASALTILEAAKANGEQPDTAATLRTLRAAVDPLFDLITPLLSRDEASQLNSQLAKANAP